MNGVRPQRIEFFQTRFLLIGWCVWLVLSLVMHRAAHTDDREIHLVPLMRGLCISIMLFVGLIWPAWRLTFRTLDAPGTTILREMSAMLGIGLLAVTTKDFAVRIEDPTAWPLHRTLLIAATLVIWSVPVGVGVWFGLRWSRPTAAMGIIMSVLAGGWVAVSLGAPAHAATVSPWHALWILGSADSIDSAPITRGLVGVGAFSLAAWLVAWSKARSRPGAVILDPFNEDPETQDHGFHHR